MLAFAGAVTQAALTRHPFPLALLRALHGGLPADQAPCGHVH